MIPVILIGIVSTVQWNSCQSGMQDLSQNVTIHILPI